MILLLFVIFSSEVLVIDILSQCLLNCYMISTLKSISGVMNCLYEVLLCMQLLSASIVPSLMFPIMVYYYEFVIIESMV